MKRLIGLAWNKPSNLLDYINDDTCVVIDEKSQGLAHGRQWVDHANESYNELITSLLNKTDKVNINFQS